VTTNAFSAGHIHATYSSIDVSIEIDKQFLIGALICSLMSEVLLTSC
jgi:hypothetical protein